MSRLRGPNWGCFPLELVDLIVGFSPANLVACSLRLLNKATASHLKGHIAVRLSQVSPHHAFVWRWGRPGAVHELSLRQRQQLLILTARSGSLANLQVAAVAAGCPLLEEVFEAAAACGHLDICQWLLASNCPHELKIVISAAARCGHVAVVRWVLQQPDLGRRAKSELGFAAWSAAAGAGCRALCEALLEDGIACVWGAPVAAARCGHEAFTDWLLQRVRIRCDHHQVELLVAVAYGLDLEALQRLYETCISTGGHRRDDDGRAVAAALVGPTPDWREKALWLQEQGYRVNTLNVEPVGLDTRPDSIARVQQLLTYRDYDFTSVAVSAVRSANLPLLRHLMKGRYWLRTRAELLTEATKAGNITLLEEVYAVYPYFDEYQHILHAAASAGHLHVLQWVSELKVGYGCAPALERALGPKLAESAASSGSVEVVEWLRGRGCPWDENTFMAAVRAGNPALLEALAAGGCPMGAPGQAYKGAVANGDLVTLRCLRQLNCPWPPSAEFFTQAVHSVGAGAVVKGWGCSLELLRWLVAEGCPVDWEAARRRVKARRDPEAGEVASWIDRRGGSG